MNTKQVGEISETAVKLALLRLGIAVLQPVGDNQRYDLVADVDSQFVRLQVKTARLSSGSVTFPVISTYHHRGRAKKTYIGEVDYIFAYCHENDMVYWYKVTEGSGKSEVRYRLEAPRNGSAAKVWAADRELGPSFIEELNMGL